MRLRDTGYLLALSTALLPVGARVLIEHGVAPGLATWLPVVFIFGVIPLLDALCGLDRSNWLTPVQAHALEGRLYFRLLVMLVVPIWLLTLAWCIQQFVEQPWGIGAQLGWLVSTGVIGGVLAINPAHELVHKSSRIEPIGGGILLASVGYHGFKVEHVRGHHLHVATPQDSSSARLGESVYRFVPRALWHNTRNAWRLEAGRLRVRGYRIYSWHNEMVSWSLVWLLMLGVTALIWGPTGALFFVAQGLLAAATLEVINYIEHYGLERRQIAAGRYERVTHHHSWNAPQRYTNWLLFNLQRHSDHHAVARRRYQALRHHADSPQLPAGNASMFVLAL
jgi:alkane 1-monooxygenase